MLRIADTRTGRFMEIPSGHRHLLRICVHLPAIGARLGAVDLRAPLVGDVLARTAELHGLQALTELGTFANLWTVTFDSHGKCALFRMWNNEV
ncbi:hypothetical protein [Streptomyces sp. NBC_01443]|uniref:hypothetical protein n=1 Tax=Streptomyces sp. NBC_01443 TaxID=2903868 RepID=UPI0022571341|nr:hypothetical protein [Streptomyces sp. NBC_01443]MCX4631308.1 hypothetical protein [Streptomyces sp. NBC_01443]